MNRNSMKKCINCAIEFTPKNPKGKCCSDKCRVYWNRKKATQSAVKQLLPPPKITTTMTWDEKQEAKKSLPKTLNELKELCPKELTGFERSQWISDKRVEYNITKIN